MKRASILFACLTGLTFAEEEEKKVVQGHVFAWPFTEAAEMQPRGGTTKGAEVTLDETLSKAWKDLQTEGLSPLEKDRRAILAMAGDYRVSFDFIEILGLTENYKPKKPYFSWATENVMVLENQEKFISLQHTLVMFFKDKDGKVSEPMVMKHWRQDWTYHDQKMFSFKGMNTWEKESGLLGPIFGSWTQAVFQVDDSPRYEASGYWSHSGAQSAWKGQAWRPLPRREFSVRDDYHVLEGQDEITITPTGWVHFQNNGKIKLSPDVERVGKEIGVNRYERITAPSLAAAGESWKKVAPYWAEVRTMWKEVYEKNEKFTLLSKVDGKKLYQHHFAYAAKIAKEGYDPKKGRTHARETITKFLAKDVPNTGKY